MSDELAGADEFRSIRREIDRFIHRRHSDQPLPSAHGRPRPRHGHRAGAGHAMTMAEPGLAITPSTTMITTWRKLVCITVQLAPGLMHATGTCAKGAH
ncbi:hypothetical protein AAW14_20090 [Streptomyces hygroscopicus]|nr:hypothetical protein [Streptomyces hygroscopicus]